MPQGGDRLYVRPLAERHDDGRMLPRGAGGRRAEKVTLAQLVAYMGYSRSRFFNLFREHTGLSPLDWLNRHRIRMAQKLLATGDTTIAEAAHQVGFAELPFFFRLFRRHAGCSPAAYRRQSIASSVASR